MKKFLSLLFIFAAVLAVSMGMAHAFHTALGLAAFVPLMPKTMGARVVNRAINLGAGTFGQGVQWLHDVLYDRLGLLSTNPLTTSLFRNKAGDTRNNVVLTLADTNNVTTQVPAGQKWMFWSLKIRYQGIAARSDATIQNMINFYRTTMIQLNIVNLDKLFTIPLSYFMGSEQFVSAPAVTVNSKYPMEAENGKWDLKVPIVLQENASWSLDVIQLAASNAGIDGDFVMFAFDREMFRAS